jgi:hypothetical protein
MAFVTYVTPVAEAYMELPGLFETGSLVDLKVAHIRGGNRDIDIEVTSDTGRQFTLRMTMQGALDFVTALTDALDM